VEDRVAVAGERGSHVLEYGLVTADEQRERPRAYIAGSAAQRAVEHADPAALGGVREELHGRRAPRGVVHERRTRPHRRERLGTGLANLVVAVDTDDHDVAIGEVGGGVRTEACGTRNDLGPPSAEADIVPCGAEPLEHGHTHLPEADHADVHEHSSGHDANKTASRHPPTHRGSTRQGTSRPRLPYTAMLRGHDIPLYEVNPGSRSSHIEERLGDRFVSLTREVVDAACVVLRDLARDVVGHVRE
jgi:hypothetical protein